MATHLTRKELKQDKFASSVEDSFLSLSLHKREVARYGGAALAVILIVAGVWYYRTSQASARQLALGEAMKTFTATVGNTPQPGTPNFPTGEAKDNAVAKAFTKIEQDYAGSSEAYIAEYYLAANKATAPGKADEARKEFQDVIGHADPNYASLAKYSLAQLDLASGHEAEGQSLLKDLMDHPTDLVSKNQATITYAKAIAAANPAEARKLLTQVASQASDGAQQAVTALADIPQK